MEELISNVYAQAGAIGVLICLAIYIAVKIMKQRDEIIYVIYEDLKKDKEKLLEQYDSLNQERIKLQETLVDVLIVNQQILKKLSNCLEGVINEYRNSTKQKVS